MYVTQGKFYGSGAKKSLNNTLDLIAEVEDLGDELKNQTLDPK